MHPPTRAFPTTLSLFLLPLASIVLAACGDEVTAPGPSVDHAAEAALSMTASARTPDLDAADRQALAVVRAATAKYHDSEVALSEGFFPTSPCVAAPGVGGMGYHYLDPDRFGDASVDPSAPELLLYEPHGDGLRLVGVEFLVLADAWDAVHDGAPSLFGVDFDEHRGAATHGLPFDHYELHVWAWRHNPAGLTTAMNPKVSCSDG